ncbi:MAG TPA: RNA methyltransferase [Candidatus Deferrimicrobium sp.]|nr:RNA methyltransferase [Candidatus Deferrimicrobium sp.]
MALSRTELKNLKSLLTKEERRQSGLFLAEGVRLLEESLRWGFLPRQVFYAGATMSPRAEDLVRGFQSRSVRTMELSNKHLAALAETRTPQGIIGLFAMPDTRLRQLYRSTDRMVVLCENLADPGNLGTLVRSALAFGFELTVLCGRSAEPYSPKVVRASAGAIFGIRIAVATLEEALQLAETRRLLLVASDPGAAKQATLPGKLVQERGVMLAIGSEADGLSDAVKKRAEYHMRIGHRDTVESLNAAVAGSIAMKQMYDLLS